MTPADKAPYIAAKAAVVIEDSAANAKLAAELKASVEELYAERNSLREQASETARLSIYARRTDRIIDRLLHLLDLRDAAE